MGVITKPNVPLEKQVNLYQYGFLSLNTDPEHWVGTSVLPQIPTLPWLNVVVPQTGKAVAGVCPSVVQGCALTIWTDIDMNNNGKKYFIISTLKVF